jgi:hypothetical protein
MSASLFTLPPGKTLTITPSHGPVYVLAPSVSIGASVSSVTTYGPYFNEALFEVRGRATGTFANVEPLADIQAAADIVDAVPAEDQSDSVTVWNDEGVLKVSTAP